MCFGIRKENLCHNYMDVQNNSHLQEEDNNAAIVGKKHRSLNWKKRSKNFLMTFC